MSFLIVRISVVTALLFLATGCSSVVNSGASELAGIAGAAVAGVVTGNPGVAAGIGLGAQAGARAGVQYAQREVHRSAQDRIAQAAGPLRIGDVAPWESEHRAPLEKGEQGRVTVSRVISVTSLECKEVVFSVIEGEDASASRAWFTTTACRESTRWKWAVAEPAVERWVNLQ